MTNPLYTVTTFPASDQAAMREFDDRYIASIGATPPPSWADMGDFVPTNSPMVTFPISGLALKYLQTEGESRFKTFLTKSFDMKVEEFDTGVETKLLDLLQQVFAYRNWQEAPKRMMLAEARHRSRAIATLLEAGEDTAWVDGVNFFSATHPADLTGTGDSTSTWSNYTASGSTVVSIPNIQAEVTIMQGALDENGEKIGADPDTILLPTATYEPVKNLLAQNLMLAGGTSTSVTSAATTNPYLGRFNVVHVPELTDANDWYLVDSKLRASSGLPPWISMRYTVPNPALELRHFDTTSDFFKDTGRIKVSSHIWYAFALAFPHAIRKVVVA